MVRSTHTWKDHRRGCTCPNKEETNCGTCRAVTMSWKAEHTNQGIQPAHNGTYGRLLSRVGSEPSSIAMQLKGPSQADDLDHVESPSARGSTIPKRA